MIEVRSLGLLRLTNAESYGSTIFLAREVRREEGQALVKELEYLQRIVSANSDMTFRFLHKPLVSTVQVAAIRKRILLSKLGSGDLEGWHVLQEPTESRG